MTKQTKLIGLIRVSTGKQGESGLGLEAQEAAIEEHRRICDGILIRTYREIESGTHDSIEDRPQLRAAVAHARRSGATLVIAKIDRLVRSTVIGAYLKTSGVKFVACDNPYANELTIDILVAVAADEARRISTRTRKRRGLQVTRPGLEADQTSVPRWCAGGGRQGDGRQARGQSSAVPKLDTRGQDQGLVSIGQGSPAKGG